MLLNHILIFLFLFIYCIQPSCVWSQVNTSGEEYGQDFVDISLGMRNRFALDTGISWDSATNEERISFLTQLKIEEQQRKADKDLALQIKEQREKAIMERKNELGKKSEQRAAKKAAKDAEIEAERVRSWERLRRLRETRQSKMEALKRGRKRR